RRRKSCSQIRTDRVFDPRFSASHSESICRQTSAICHSEFGIRNPQSAMPETPAQLGYRMPAEWEPHEATWIAWPHNRADWPGKFQPIPWIYADIVRHLARGEHVRIIV